LLQKANVLREGHQIVALKVEYFKGLKGVKRFQRDRRNDVEGKVE